MKLIYFFVVIFTFITVHTNAQTGSSLQKNVDDNTLLWEISGNGLKSSSYLFGTFHLLCKNDIHFSVALKQAVINSKEVYLELDMDDPATLMGAMMLMNMNNGKNLKDFYTDDEYKRILIFFKDSLQMGIGFFQQMKPAMLETLLYPKMMPCNHTTSVEEYMVQLAKKAGKEIKGLETIAFQASVFDSIPYEKQAEELLHSIDSMKQAKKYFGEMLDAYKEQRLDKIENIINNFAFGTTQNQDVLLGNRNKNWVVQLKEIMKNGSVFTAVGAGHLIGKNGLIALLRAAGFTVSGLINK